MKKSNVAVQNTANISAGSANTTVTGSAQAVKPQRDFQSRKYLLTINNPLPEFMHEKIKQAATLSFKTFEYLAMADEIGEQGTPHTHIFLCFTSAVRFSTVKKYFPTAHIDAVKGSVQDNLDYIRKQGKWADTAKAETSVPGTFEELGTRPAENKGKNYLLEQMFRMVVDEGLSNTEIIRINQDYIPYLDTMTRLRTASLREKYRSERPVEVVYVSGKTGTGKSHDILHEHGAENVYRVTDYLHPFDQYEMQDVIVFEEFRTSDSYTCLSLGEMLNYLDIYPVLLRARYANKFAVYTKVYIVSNVPLEDQYTGHQHGTAESWKAFLRRIGRVKEYTGLGVFQEYASVEEYYRAKDPRGYRKYFGRTDGTDENGFRPVGAYEQGEIPFGEQGADA